MSISIIRTTNEEILKDCALLMSASEPWITLQRKYSDCLNSTHGDYKEIYIAQNNNELLGFIILQMAGTFKGYIQSICVSPEARSKGIGSMLIEFAEKRIFTVSPNVFMCVSSFNERAIKLYTQLGYEKIGELKDFILKGYSEILLRKTTGTLAEFTNAHYQKEKI